MVIFTMAALSGKVIEDWFLADDVTTRFALFADSVKAARFIKGGFT